jgi:peptidyl-prolyl cis-trans isomerase D
MVLKKLRHKKTAKKIWIVLAILILPAFVLWGSGSVMRGRQESSMYAGIISGRRIPISDYQDALSAVTNQAIIRFGDNLAEIQKYVNLPQQAWIRLILLAEAKKRGITASDKEVVETIQSYPFFQRQGRFDQRLYSEMLQYVFHVQPRVFEEQTRQNIIISKLYDRITSDIKVTDAQIREEYRKANEELSIYYIASLPADFIKGLNPAEQEIKDYFAKNKLNFKQPLSYNVEYVSLDSQDKINKISSRLSKREKFSDAAQEFGIQVKESGLFSENDPIPGIGWLPQITGLLSKAKTGDYLPVIRIDKSFYILRIKEIKTPYIPDFESIKEKVKDAFIKEKAYKTAKAKIENCLEELEAISKTNPKSADFERVAKKEGLKSGETGMFKYGSYIEGIGGSDIFWLKAQELKEDRFSRLINTPTGFYIIKLKSRAGLDENKFNREKNDFAKNLILQKKAEYFAEFTEALRKKSQAFF